MKILEVCPLWFPVSRDAPGGRETLLAYVIDALQDLNCEITYIASGDSSGSGECVPVGPVNLYAAMHAGDVKEYLYYEQQQLRIVLERAAQFDVVHSHVGGGAFYCLVFLVCGSEPCTPSTLLSTQICSGLSVDTPTCGYQP